MPRYDPHIFQIFESIKKDDHIIALYFAEQKTADILARASAVAIEQTTGTWIDVPEETAEVKERSIGKVIGVYEIPDWNTMPEVPAELGDRKFIAAIAYPTVNIGGQIPEMLTVLYGNISMLSNLKLLDVYFPESFIKNFKGPKYGIEGVRKLLKVEGRPLLCAMFKPCVGALPKTLGKMFWELGLGGIDIIKDDELLADPEFCTLEARLEECLRVNEKLKKETGHSVLYTINISDRPDLMHKKALKVQKMGGNALMINLYTAGFSAFQQIAEDPQIKLPILAHPAMAGSYYASPHHGFTAALTLGKLARLSGADIIIYPSPFGKVPLVREKAVRVAQELRAPFYHLRPTFPGPGAGSHPGIVPALVENMGSDIVIGAGGGIHGHPRGATAGVKAFLQAIAATMDRQDLRPYAVRHKELKAALDKWGVYGEKNIFDLTK
ncbi:MAG: ribulose 1,5-bisphosphate carboxylase [Elusimicrobia bacterium]|nr:ribulose 1,5-bisphosphate carboxylase [Candidatus Obscuribacterium magneticum]